MASKIWLLFDKLEVEVIWLFAASFLEVNSLLADSKCRGVADFFLLELVSGFWVLVFNFLPPIESSGSSSSFEVKEVTEHTDSIKFGRLAGS